MKDETLQSDIYWGTEKRFKSTLILTLAPSDLYNELGTSSNQMNKAT